MESRISGPPNAHHLHRPQRGLPLFFIALLLSGCATGSSAESTGELFDRFEVETGMASRQTIVPGFFLGGDTAETIVLHVDRTGGRHLQMFGIDDGAWESVLNAKLDRRVLFVDVANVGGRDRLITCQNGQLNWFDPAFATEHQLVEVTTNYNATDKGEIPHLDITRDLNGDGRDDIVIPDVDGFWISVQRSDGSFSEALQFGPPEPHRNKSGLVPAGIDDSRSYGEVGITAFTLPLYQDRVHSADVDRDGRSDLVFWNEDHFDVYLQDESGLFDPLARTLTVDVPLDADGAYSRVFGFSEEGPVSLLFGFNEHSSQTTLHSLGDLNGDQVTDMVTLTLSGRSLIRQRSIYEVHFGISTAAGIAFEGSAGAVLAPRSKGGGIQPWGYSSRLFRDFDDDGDVDVMFRDIRIGIGGMSRALLGNSVSMDLEFYRLDAGVYPDKPTTILRIRPALKPFSGRDVMFFPTALTGDVDGDGRVDLLVAKSRQELQVFFGVPGPGMFAPQPHTLAIDLPADMDRSIRLLDFNNDARQDILLHHPSTTQPNRLTMLVARQLPNRFEQKGRPYAGDCAAHSRIAQAVLP